MDLPKGITIRKDGRYQGRFTCNGKRYTLYGLSLEEVTSKMQKCKGELTNNICPNISDISFGAFYRSWLNDSKKNIVKPSTLAVYKEIYKLYLKPHLEYVNLSSIRKIDLQKILNNMADNGLSPNTIAKTKSILYSVFKEALDNRIISYNPCENIIIKKESTERRVLTVSEQKTFLNAIAGSRYEALCILALATGLRIGELSGLKWEDIDFEKKTLSVKRTYAYIHDVDKKIMYDSFHSPKTKRSIRTIYLIDPILTLLKKEKEKQQAEIKKAGAAWQPVPYGENLVFTSKTGKPIRQTYVNEMLDLYVKKINDNERYLAHKEGREPVLFRKITPHTLRHTFATRAFENGIPPKVVQQILGHASLDMTMNLYTHVTEDIQSKEMQKMNQSFSDQP